MPKFFSRKNEKIICSHFFLQKNENKSFMLISENWHSFLLKSILGFENWTKKMSKIENRNHFSEETRALTENMFLYGFYIILLR